MKFKKLVAGLIALSMSFTALVTPLSENFSGVLDNIFLSADADSYDVNEDVVLYEETVETTDEMSSKDVDLFSNEDLMNKCGLIIPEGQGIPVSDSNFVKLPEINAVSDTYVRDKYSNDNAYNTISQSDSGAKMQTAYLRLYNSALEVHYACAEPTEMLNGHYVAAKVSLSDLKLTRDDVYVLYQALMYSNPQFYWLAQSWTYYYLNDGTITQLCILFDDDLYSAETRTYYNSLLDKKVQEYVTVANSYSTNYEKVKAVYDKLISEVEYAYDSNNVPVSDKWAHSVIGAIDSTYSEVVCEGYSAILSLVLNYIGIDNYFVTGMAYNMGGHAWNLIELDDGLFYWFDPTWDDPGDGYTSEYDYFAMTDDVFCYYHVHGTVNDANVYFCLPLPAISDEPFDLDLIDNGTKNTVSIQSNGMTFIGDTAKKTCVLTSYTGSGSLSVPSTVNGYTVTEIGDAAFKNCTGLTSVTLPSTVKKIGKSAFERCTSLTTVKLYGVVDIEEKAFYCCFALNSFSANIGLKTLGEYALANCSSLTQITLPYTVKYINNYCFLFSGLKSISIDKGVGRHYASDNGVLYSQAGHVLVAYPNYYASETFEIPSKVIEIGDAAFYGNENLQIISIGGNVTKIGFNAFNNSKLLYAELLDPVETVEGYAFYRCKNLSSMKIYDSVTDIGAYAFGYLYDSELGQVYVNTSFTIMCNSDTAIADYCTQKGIARINYDGTHEHVYTSEIITPATCKTDGLKKYTCAICGYNYSEVIASTGKHNYVTTVVAPTYAAQGYTIHTCSGCGDSYKDTYTDQLVLSIVTGLKMTANTTTSISMSWDTVTDATSYYIYKHENDTWIKLGEVTSNSCIVSNLVSGKEYEFAVCPVITIDGVSYWNSNVTPVIMTTLPANVSGLKMTANTPTSISMSWNKVSGATGYAVYQYIDGKWKTIKKTTANSLTVSSLKSGTNYKFTVKAYKTVEGNNYYSPSYTGVTMTTTPAKPTIKLSSYTTNSIKISWNKVTGATKYVVYKKVDGKWVNLGTTTATSYTYNNLKSGTGYQFAVRAYKTYNGKNYYSPFSSSTDTFYASTKPATVSFTLTAGSKKATVKWNKVTGATGYIVYYKTSSTGSWQKLTTTTGTSYTKTGLTSGKTYYFTVKAYKTYNGKTYNASYTTKSVKAK